MIHPFQIFSTLLKLSSLCPKSQQIINKIKVSWYELTMSPNSSIPSQIPPFSEREVSLLSRRLISPPPSDLTTSHLLETLLHQLIIFQIHPFY